MNRLSPGRGQSNSTTEPPLVVVGGPLARVIVYDQNVTLARVERSWIEETLSFTSGNKTSAAKILGISLKTLYNKLATYAKADADDNHGR